MPRKLNHATAVAWLLGISFILQGIPAFAEPPAVEEVLGVLGMDKGQIAELAQGQPVTYALSEEQHRRACRGHRLVSAGSFGQGGRTFAAGTILTR